VLRIVATNRATNHPNLVHNDEFAQSVGFRGGLVPGVDVYAYLTRRVVELWGRAWLIGGEAGVRFVRPVYDGDELEIDAATERSPDLEIVARCGREVRAILTARLESTTEYPRPDDFPEAPLVEPRLKAACESFTEGQALGSLAVVLNESDCSSQLAEVGETLDLYGRERIAHPGHLLRFADAVLSANVDLPPWLHVGSSLHHYGLVHWNDSISVRARVMATFVRNGHQFIQLDVLMVGADGRPRLRVMPYTAIYRPSFIDM
jgi:hypothetical protein